MALLVWSFRVSFWDNPSSCLSNHSFIFCVSSWTWNYIHSSYIKHIYQHNGRLFFPLISLTLNMATALKAKVEKHVLNLTDCFDTVCLSCLEIHGRNFFSLVCSLLTKLSSICLWGCHKGEHFHCGKTALWPCRVSLTRQKLTLVMRYGTIIWVNNHHYDPFLYL